MSQQTPRMDEFEAKFIAECEAVAKDGSFADSVRVVSQALGRLVADARALELECARLERDAARFKYLQNIPVKDAQAFFWNFSSRKQRAAAIDKARAALTKEAK